ncbi:nitroreductase [Mycolicibacterium novocastrense]|uniref:nitroreductase family protein n=1 Tax=Mycolicibacterium novocastrense TaxID=59813 RepID=UPI000747EC7A|nr:nitroreductase family protein [Mycolicibacterium novocastrense]KUH72480.1 nitroreductase [Mycolicibacterium novocastrense]KUH72843.1 nitroreductase [Mycolicibacterium novocastrense]KUH77086.1 nitroreductase [Mycolicibacterium novocastrense]
METASAVRRYREDPVDDDTLERCLRAASWAPSGANQQPWRFVVLRSEQVRAVVTAAAHRSWEELQRFYGVSAPGDGEDDSRSRVLRSMAEHMRTGGAAPGLVLFCVRPQAGASELQQGGSIFPAVQNFLLAARAQGLGAAITLWHSSCEDQLRSLVGIPDDWMMAALVTVGWPAGRHHSVRRKPLSEVAVVDNWDQPWPSRDPR